jgi:hypothetical protein
MKMEAMCSLNVKRVKQVWRQLQLEEIRENLCEVSNNMLLLETILNLEEEDKLMTCCTLWIWWAERTKLTQVQILEILNK